MKRKPSLAKLLYDNEMLRKNIKHLEKEIESRRKKLDSYKKRDAA